MAKQVSKQRARTEENVLEGERISFVYNNRTYDVAIEQSFTMSELTPFQMKRKLDKCPAYLAFWRNLLVDVEREIEDAQEEFEVWFAGRYDVIEKQAERTKARTTETWMKNRVLLENADDYRRRKGKIRDSQDVSKRLNALIRSYDTLSWTLRTIGQLTAAEFGTIEAQGKRNLKDL